MANKYELQMEGMERFKDVGNNQDHIKLMKEAWNNDIEEVIKKLATVSYEKNIYRIELEYMCEKLLKIIDTVTMDNIDLRKHVERVLKEIVNT